MEDLHHHELMEVLMPAKEEEGGGQNKTGTQSKINNPNSMPPPRVHTSRAKDAFPQTHRGRFQLHDKEEMQMCLRHLDPQLAKRFNVSFSKKRKGSNGHSRD
jgi:hypothetical protein